MKKIVTSIGMIAFIGAMVAAGTGAFFNDTETSTGNVFTAGALDLKVDSVAHINGLVCFDGVWVPESEVVWDAEEGLLLVDGADVEGASQEYNTVNPANEPQAGDECAGTWELTDLGPTNTFFNYGDLKPGDQGENTISLHVNNNDAYMCAIIDNVADLDNGITEPEGESGDTSSSTGELDSELNFFIWEDDGDNIFEEAETEGVLVEGADGTDIEGTYPLYTPSTTVFPGGETKYLGMYWCYGEFSRVGTDITCDGGPVTNLSQTDSLEADISFYIEQARNNPNFECPSPELPPPPPATTTLTVNKVVTNDNGGTAQVADFALTVSGVGAVISGVATPVVAGAYDVNETGISGYAATFGGDCDADGNVTVATGTNAVCTITNNDIPASITLNKVVVGGNATATDFTLRVNGNAVPTGGSVSVNGNTTHTINEDAFVGYAFTSITGDAKCPAVLGGATSVLNLAESITCTITNTEIIN